VAVKVRPAVLKLHAASNDAPDSSFEPLVARPVAFPPGRTERSTVTTPSPAPRSTASPPAPARRSPAAPRRGTQLDPDGTLDVYR
jgi:hypothetical protein